MALILNIDSSGKQGLVALARDGVCLHKLINNEPMQHAAFLQPAIREVFKETGISFNEVDAVAVCNGPGSYTGLRVGLASAKGLCFAWNKPLITLNSLYVMAFAECQNMTENASSPCSTEYDNDVAASPTNIKNSLPILYCPMIDARRMEVFFALYARTMQELIPPSAAIVDVNFLDTYLENHIIKYFGSGAIKWREIALSPHAAFCPEPQLHKAFCALSYKKYLASDFDMLASAEPFYVKEFFTAHPAFSKKS
jgi:tRNA threonylcarbamoyladenosine biosynthesis protein TsaB